MKDLIFNTDISPELVLANYEICRSSNIDEIRNSGSKILCDNDLRINHANSLLDAHFFYRKIGKAGIGRLSYGCDVTIMPSTFEDFFLIQIPFRGYEEIKLGNQHIVTSPKVISIINPDVKSVIHHYANTEKLIIRLDKKLIEKNCQQILNKTIKYGLQFEPTMQVESKAGIQWLRMMHWINNFVSDEDHLSPIMVGQIENNLVNMLLNYQKSNYYSDIHNEHVSIAPSFVRKVENYIQDNAHQPITINDLAEIAGVSTRSLFTGFKKYRNTTPMRYLKDVRLELAYEDLKKASIGRDKVTNIAYKWGFSHLGYFSTDYKNRFGETPYETLSK